MSRGLATAALLVGIACASPPQESPPPDIAVIRAQLDSLWSKYSAAAVAGDGDAIARLYTDSLYLVESGLPTIRGNAALQSTVREVLGAVKFLESSITPEMTEVLGDRVLQLGTYRDVLQETGKPVQVVNGRFSAVFRRDSSAGWKVDRLIAVADSTVPQAKAK